jgi:hypothetical protein
MKTSSTPKIAKAEKQKIVSMQDGTIAFYHSDGTVALIPPHAIERSKEMAVKDEGSRLYEATRILPYIIRTLRAQNSLWNKGSIEADMGEIIGTDCLATYDYIMKKGITTREVTTGTRRGCLEAVFDKRSKVEPLAEPTSSFHVVFMARTSSVEATTPLARTQHQREVDARKQLKLNEKQEVLFVSGAAPGKIPDLKGAIVPPKKSFQFGEPDPIPRLVWADKSPNRKELLGFTNEDGLYTSLSTVGDVERLLALPPEKRFGKSGASFDDLPSSPGELEQAIREHFAAYREATLLAEGVLNLPEKAACLQKNMLGRGGPMSLVDELVRIVRYTELMAGKIDPEFYHVGGDKRPALIASKKREGREDICFRINGAGTNPVPILYCEQVEIQNSHSKSVKLRKMGFYRESFNELTETIYKETLKPAHDRRVEDRAILESIQPIISGNTVRRVNVVPSVTKAAVNGDRVPETGRRMHPHIRVQKSLPHR